MLSLSLSLSLSFASPIIYLHLFLWHFIRLWSTLMDTNDRNCSFVGGRIPSVFETSEGSSLLTIALWVAGVYMLKPNPTSLPIKY